MWPIEVLKKIWAATATIINRNTTRTRLTPADARRSSASSESGAGRSVMGQAAGVSPVRVHHVPHRDPICPEEIGGGKNHQRGQNPQIRIRRRQSKNVSFKQKLVD